jgi:hypothetical protein
MLDLNRFPEYRTNPDGSDPTDAQRMQIRREARYVKTHHANAVDQQQPKQSNPYRSTQGIFERELEVYGDDKDEKGKYLKDRAQHYQALADKWDEENKPKSPEYRRDISKAMADVEANQSRFLPDELVALRVRADIAPDPHGIAEGMFWERLAEVESAALARDTAKQVAAREEVLRRDVEALQADVRVIVGEQRLKEVNEKL